MEPSSAPEAPAEDSPSLTFGDWLTRQCIAYQARRGEWIQTDTAFARLVGVAPSTFLNWRTNSARPRRVQCQRLADLFGVSLDEVHGALMHAPAADLPTAEVEEYTS